MESLKQYLIHNFEGVFVLVILTFVSAIVWLVDSKLPFLNFFYLPVLLSSYYLGIRSGVRRNRTLRPLVLHHDVGGIPDPYGCHCGFYPPRTAGQHHRSAARQGRSEWQRRTSRTNYVYD